MRFLLVVVAALAFAGPAAAACPTLADLEGEVMCPECKTTLDQSDAPVARDIKRFIERPMSDALSARFIPPSNAPPGAPIGDMGQNWLARPDQCDWDDVNPEMWLFYRPQ